MILASFAFAVLAFTLAAILAHMVPMLGTLGLGTMAVVVGSIFGPAQVRQPSDQHDLRHEAFATAVISGLLMVLGVIILGLSGNWLPGAVAFVICLGLGSGINSIVQGSLPLYLFGSDGYGAVKDGRDPARHRGCCAFCLRHHHAEPGDWNRARR
jgi:hypothetical protein